MEKTQIVSKKIHTEKSIKKKNNFIIEIFKELVKNKFLYLLMVPGIIFFLVFSYLPLGGLAIAFQNFSYSKGIFGSEFIGFDNFKFLFSSKDIVNVLFNTVFLNIIFIISSTIASITIAIMFVETKNKHFKKLTQSLSILPNFISWTVVALFLQAFLSSDGGILYNLLESTGHPISFYQESWVWPIILTVMKIWHGAGFGSIVYIATLTGIDPQIYEAADIDGATRWQKIIKITIPMLKPTIVLLTLFSVGKIFYGDFGMIYALVGDNALLYQTTDVIDTFVYRSLRQLGDIGMSSATGLVQSLLGFGFVVGANKLAKKIDEEAAIF